MRCFRNGWTHSEKIYSHQYDLFSTQTDQRERVNLLLSELDISFPGLQPWTPDPVPPGSSSSLSLWRERCGLRGFPYSGKSVSIENLHLYIQTLNANTNLIFMQMCINSLHSVSLEDSNMLFYDILSILDSLCKILMSQKLKGYLEIVTPF